jgi:hypothetical protein
MINIFNERLSMTKLFTKLILTKISEEGFEKEFNSYEDACKEVNEYLCIDCAGWLREEEPEELFWEMLDTGCGCEFMVEFVE